MGPACLLQSPGSLANQGGMTNYWGDNGGIGGGRDASSFMFGGSYSYAVTLIGSYAGNSSEVGWFTKSGGVYTFHPITDWGNKTINHSETINTGGLDWGFYVKNTALDATGNCAPQTSCSDATGGFSSTPFNQFAMFINSGGTQLLVGLEDNRLSPLWNGPDPTNNPTNRDSDYNDYIFRITPSSLVHCGRTLGFWKNKGLADGWPSPYTPGQTIGSVFNAAAAGTAASVTLLDALDFKGGPTLQDKKNLLLKQAVAALLNSAVPTFNYPLSTSALISAVNAALLSGNATTINNLQSQLDGFNNLEGCANP
jgi:hypothetical protein